MASVVGTGVSTPPAQLVNTVQAVVQKFIHSGSWRPGAPTMPDDMGAGAARQEDGWRRFGLSEFFQEEPRVARTMARNC